MRQERLLSVGTDGGGYINLLCTNKDDLSLWSGLGGGVTWRASLPGDGDIVAPPEAAPIDV